jgi:hypothetical protein
MRFFAAFTLFIAFFLGACAEDEPASPLKTLQTYQKAMKAKDTTTMKLLLTADSIKMLEQEAKSQGSTVDDVVKRETLFGESQKTIEFRNQNVQGETATIEVKNTFGQWDTVPFRFEDGQWKIDKKGFADRLMQDIMRQQNDAFGDVNSNSSMDFPTPQTSPF